MVPLVGPGSFGSDLPRAKTRTPELRDHVLEAATSSDDPIEDVVDLTRIYRRFATENPQLMRTMFSQPFADFDPGPDEARALEGDETDIVHGLLALWSVSAMRRRRRAWDAAGRRSTVAGAISIGLSVMSMSPGPFPETLDTLDLVLAGTFFTDPPA